MARHIDAREKSKGKAPGSLIFIGNRKMDSTLIRMIDFHPDNLVEKELSSFFYLKDRQVINL